ncbi:WxcM-like domain-containing protein [Desulfobacter hydrogenophilus]|uniref:WxcM-like domain-containing protein n=1 Tax=Desulfobacter hydrogenophilus TaxID=2291 RepID=A0A328FAG5_9BACT|nr:FdtA/QdtA family cupin domain-containing protein [Desulfobacter hydrogenophilus]NDY74540.1 WxcM-like domain-containing protein [Desulfobacter hydrogenophilus]QBH14103.1 WxcM-like domain-containing protein [Desulfobacter hydrogenophilus]RAM01664.1 WxcM-like domain-containing protein [Desulfobacter hydrogenophilus]
MSTTIYDCKLIELPRFYDRRGSLTPIYNQDHIPFDIVRTYYLYDIPGGKKRGGHAHKNLQQLYVSVMGAFDVTLDDGKEKKTVRLDRAYKGLYIPKLIWRDLHNFSSGANCLVLASLLYDEYEYIRDYDQFLGLKRGA